MRSTYKKTARSTAPSPLNPLNPLPLPVFYEKIIFLLLRIRGIINCFLGVTLISNYSALFCIIIITENADKHMEFLDFCHYRDLLDIILEYSK